LALSPSDHPERTRQPTSLDGLITRIVTSQRAGSDRYAFKKLAAQTACIR
jgi:hypothetical protein